MGTMNYNPSMNTNFKMEIPGLEDFNYFVQDFTLPGLSLQGVESPFKNNQTNVPGNSITYDMVNITFIVSEDYANHSQIRLWMHRIERGRREVMKELKDTRVVILDSNKVPVQEVIFYGSYPTMLSEISLMSDSADTIPSVCNCTLKYQYYDVKPL